MIEMKVAQIGDFDQLWRFYEEVCTAMETDEYSPSWHLGIYPDREDLLEHLEREEFLLGMEDGRIAGAMVLTGREDELYSQVPWKIPFVPEKVCAVHLLAVHPDFRRKGVSRKLVEAIFEQGRKSGKHVVHLDVVKGNLPAEKLYQNMGFRFTCEMDVFYEDTGDLTVRLYEYPLFDMQEKHV